MNTRSFRFSFLASVIVNFLRSDGEKCYVAVCFSRIAIAITTSKKHVREGRRICLFVCNAELIGPKLRMV